MLKSLHIYNYALIRDIKLNFGDSFVTLTGETGAGKSIILGALSLVLGSRADREVIRDQAKKCIVEAEFDLSHYKLKPIFEKLDIDYEHHTILRREISTTKSRTFVNDTPVNLKTLQELKPFLVDIHSQNEAYLLSTSQFQYTVLDKLSKDNSKLLDVFTTKYNTLLSLKSDLKTLEIRKVESRKRQDYVQYLFDELEGFKLRKGMQVEIEQDYQVLKHADQIKLLLSEGLSILNTEELGIIEQVSTLNRSLGQLTSYLESFSELSNRVNSIYIELSDIEVEFERQIDRLEDDPEKLEQVEGQLQNLNALLLKHQVKTDEDLLRLQYEFEQELQLISDYDHQISSHRDKITSLTQDLNKISTQLTSNRKLTAKTIEKKLIKGLSQLGMQNSSFKIQIQTSSDFNTYGKDTLEWLFSANIGMPLRPIQKVVSGGEMSRVLLVLKSILASHENLPCLIFDEIDTGVSGEIALKMAHIMESMSSSMQVISITHLPQIAAKGKQHLKVLKLVKDKHTETQIINLNADQRVVELAQMLGGDENASSAIAHAKSLLN